MKIIKFLIYIVLLFYGSGGSLSFAHTASIQNLYSGIPLSFTKNAGQTDSRVKFSAPGKNCTLFFTESGTTILLHGKNNSAYKQINSTIPDSKLLSASLGSREDEAEFESFAVKVNFHGANPNPEISGENELPGKSNYFIGADSTQWKTDVPSYEKIRLKNLYDGIDLVYYGGGSGLKYDFIVRAGKDPSKIALGYDLGADGGNALSIDRNGSLTLRTSLGEIVEKTPVCYQTINGMRVPVEASYKIIDSESNMYGFSIGDYDTEYELCIDPELGYSCYIGGTEKDIVNDIAVDKDGNVYITGQTYYSGFPSTPGTYETTHENSGSFVLKINPSGSSLIYSAFIGEDGIGVSIAIDEEGNAFIAGDTISSKIPATSGAYRKYNSGDQDIFILKLNSQGNSLIYSTYLGGASLDSVGNIDIDKEGNLYITGDTWPAKYVSFPTTPGVVDSVLNGRYNCFITKLNPDGSNLVYSTFIGGSTDLDSEGYDYEDGVDIKVTSDGSVYIIGRATTQNFPVTAGAYDTDKNQTYKYFVLKLKPDASAIPYATFLLGYRSNSLDIDEGGNVYIVGDIVTSKSGKTISYFPQTETEKPAGSIQLNDGFVLRLNNTLSHKDIFYKTNILDEFGKFSDITLDNEKNIFITGQTNSINFPITEDAYHSTLSGGIDCFVVKFDSTCTNILYSTFYGSIGQETEPRIAADKNGNIYISGTATKTFITPFVTPGAYSSEYNGGEDIFIAKFVFNPVVPSVEEQEKSNPQDFSLTNSPNPFNPSTTIEYSIPKETRVSLKIYNITGQEIALLKDGIESAGNHSVIWDAKGMPSGVYFCTMKADGYAGTKKMMLLR